MKVSTLNLIRWTTLINFKHFKLSNKQNAWALIHIWKFYTLFEEVQKVKISGHSISQRRLPCYLNSAAFSHLLDKRYMQASKPRGPHLESMIWCALSTEFVFPFEQWGPTGPVQQCYYFAKEFLLQKSYQKRLFLLAHQLEFTYYCITK